MEERELIVFDEQTLKDEIQKIEGRIKSDKSAEKRSIQILNDLSEFDLGKFLILNKKVNRYWSSYVINHEYDSKNLTGIESIILEGLPITIATQQRAQIFKKQIQKYLNNGTTIASIPCAMSEDVFNLDFSNVTDYSLVGINDPESLRFSEKVAKEKGLDEHFESQSLNPWKILIENELDLIVSNGLNVYEQDEDKIVNLYSSFNKALKSDGVLITSFLTPPPNPDSDQESPWNMDQIEDVYLLIQKIIFSDILQASWQNFMQEDQFADILEKAEFGKIEVFQDKANIFPTVVAHKGR